MFVINWRNWSLESDLCPVLTSMATAHHHFREMIGLWSLVHYWLESQPDFHVVSICLSLSIDHQLLPFSTRTAQLRRNCQTTFCSPVLFKTTVTSPPHHLLPCFLKKKKTFKHKALIFMLSQFHRCSVNRKDEGESTLMCSYRRIFFTLFEYL